MDRVTRPALSELILCPALRRMIYDHSRPETGENGTACDDSLLDCLIGIAGGPLRRIVRS